MCRIIGFIDSDYLSYDAESVLDGMRDTMVSGGPDGYGSYFQSGVALAHRRLSIIELSDLGHQPMFSLDNQFIIVFNGEVYNHAEIRLELEELGHHFKSHSDTEVVLQSYIEWGSASLNKFHGMFAYTIFDVKKNSLFLARDRTGIKPLYFYKNDSIFIFSSELKALHKHPKFKKEISATGLNQFLKYSYIPAPYSIFKNCFKLLPGHFMELNVDSLESSIHQYWNPDDAYLKPKLNISYEEALIELERILSNSFNLRMVSDVPVGMFLSGGVDSSTLLGLLGAKAGYKLKTFTIGFEESEFNEAIFAKEYAKHIGSEHHEHYLTKQDALDIIPLLPDIWDEPFADASQIPTYLVSKFTGEHVTVSLSADGGDELFYGYPKYQLTPERVETIKKNKLLFAIISKFPDSVLKLIGGMFGYGDKFIKAKNVVNSDYDILSAFDSSQHIYSEYYQDRMIKLKDDVDFSELYFKNVTDLDGIQDCEKMLLADYKSYMPDDILVKVDRATMAVGLEGREPFLDQDIYEFVARLTFEYKYDGKTTKKILRDVLYKYIPKELVERPKMGFGIPLEAWCREDPKLRGLLEYYFSKEKIESDGIFNYDVVKPEIEKYFAGKKVSFNKIWTLFMFQMWFDRWMKESNI